MKCVFIANVKSGKGNILKYKDFIISKLKEKFEEVIWQQTEYAGHATKLAKEFGCSVDYLFFSGGDGTLNEIVNGIFQNSKQPIVGQVPSGTVNDFSKSIGMKRKISKAINQLTNSQTKQIDIYRVGEKYGVYICGFGVFTRTSYETAQTKKAKMGWLSYFFSGLKEIKSYIPQNVEFTINGEKKTEKVALCLLINSKSVGGFKFNKNAKLCDKNMDFIAFTTKKDKIRLLDLIRIAKLFLFGFKSVRRSCLCGQVNNISVSSNSDIYLNFDGELGFVGPKFCIEVIPNALNIIAPSKDI